jgi:hypothetical protein
VNDFEMVRDGLLSDGPDAEMADAALDRIEAEVERLREELLVERELRRWFAAKARERGFDDEMARAAEEVTPIQTDP